MSLLATIITATNGANPDAETTLYHGALAREDIDTATLLLTHTTPASAIDNHARRSEHEALRNSWWEKTRPATQTVDAVKEIRTAADLLTTAKRSCCANTDVIDAILNHPKAQGRQQVLAAAMLTTKQTPSNRARLYAVCAQPGPLNASAAATLRRLLERTGVNPITVRTLAHQELREALTAESTTSDTFVTDLLWERTMNNTYHNTPSQTKIRTLVTLLATGNDHTVRDRLTSRWTVTRGWQNMCQLATDPDIIDVIDNVRTRLLAAGMPKEYAESLTANTRDAAREREHLATAIQATATATELDGLFDNAYRTNRSLFDADVLAAFLHQTHTSDTLRARLRTATTYLHNRVLDRIADTIADNDTATWTRLMTMWAAPHKVITRHHTRISDLPACVNAYYDLVHYTPTKVLTKPSPVRELFIDHLPASALIDGRWYRDDLEKVLTTCYPRLLAADAHTMLTIDTLIDGFTGTVNQLVATAELLHDQDVA